MVLAQTLAVVVLALQERRQSELLEQVAKSDGHSGQVERQRKLALGVVERLGVHREAELVAVHRRAELGALLRDAARRRADGRLRRQRAVAVPLLPLKVDAVKVAHRHDQVGDERVVRALDHRREGILQVDLFALKELLDGPLLVRHAILDIEVERRLRGAENRQQLRDGAVALRHGKELVRDGMIDATQGHTLVASTRL